LGETFFQRGIFGIDAFINENSVLNNFNKESGLLEKLIDLNHSDAKKYCADTEVTLYYTGADIELDWYTLEEGTENKYAINNPTIRKISTEFQYREEMEQVAKRYEGA